MPSSAVQRSTWGSSSHAGRALPRQLHQSTVLYNPYQHISQQFLTLVEAIESKDIPTVKRPVGGKELTIPPMAVDQAEVDALSQRFRSDFPQAVGKKVILLSPGGGLLPIRAWPVTHFCQLAESLVRDGYLVAIIGLGRDKETAKAIVSHCDSEHCIDLTGYTKTVRELMLLFHFATLLIANDGGPGHFAAMTPIRPSCSSARKPSALRQLGRPRGEPLP